MCVCVKMYLNFRTGIVIRITIIIRLVFLTIFCFGLTPSILSSQLLDFHKTLVFGAMGSSHQTT